MAQQIKGPFTIKWGDNTIEQVEGIDVEFTIDSNDIQTIQGHTYELDGAFKVSATMTFLATDLASLAILLPQHFVANGELMSTGETVNNANGAIDIKPNNCDQAVTYNNFDFISCGINPQVFRIVNARIKFEGYELDDKIQKAMVKIIGESDSDEATVQFFTQGTINVVS